MIRKLWWPTCNTWELPSMVSKFLLEVITSNDKTIIVSWSVMLFNQATWVIFTFFAGNNISMIRIWFHYSAGFTGWAERKASWVLDMICNPNWLILGSLNNDVSHAQIIQLQIRWEGGWVRLQKRGDPVHWRHYHKIHLIKLLKTMKTPHSCLLVTQLRFELSTSWIQV